LKTQAQDVKSEPVTSPAFSTPINIAGVSYTHFVMREPTIQDMFDAEEELAQYGKGTDTPIAFNAEMMIRQITRVSNAEGGAFDGPFTLNMLKSWGTKNWRALRNHQIKVDLLGEV